MCDVHFCWLIILKRVVRKPVGRRDIGCQDVIQTVDSSVERDWVHGGLGLPLCCFFWCRIYKVADHNNKCYVLGCGLPGKDGSPLNVGEVDVRRVGCKLGMFGRVEANSTLGIAILYYNFEYCCVVTMNLSVLALKSLKTNVTHNRCRGTEDNSNMREPTTQLLATRLQFLGLNSPIASQFFFEMSFVNLLSCS